MQSDATNRYVADTKDDRGTDTLAAPVAMDLARRILSPGRFCILDVETTDLDGAIVEIAVIAADTGAVLFEEMIDPGGIAISDEAGRVHRISAVDLVGARQWAQIFPELLEAVGSREIAAYKWSFDFGRIMFDCKRNDLHPGGFADTERWQCIMALRSAARADGSRLRLDGGHRALDDVRAAREIVVTIAHGCAP